MRPLLIRDGVNRGRPFTPRPADRLALRPVPIWPQLMILHSRVGLIG